MSNTEMTRNEKIEVCESALKRHKRKLRELQQETLTYINIAKMKEEKVIIQGLQMLLRKLER